jgi:hypothetical protein
VTVREEAVRLSLEDSGFSTGIAKDAAAVALLKRELDGLPGSASKSSQSTRTASKDFDNLGRSAENGSRSIDKFSGRLGLLISAATALGPALVPIGAVGIPAIAGLASEVGFLAIGVGTTALAFDGLGKALTAFDKAALQPTAANIAAAQVAMDKLSPSAQQFVLSLHQLEPELTKLQQSAGEGLFPGLTSGLDKLVADSPIVRSALQGIGSELGSLADRAGGALADSEWQAFLKHVGQEAPSELEKLGQATGDVTHGLMELFLAFDPLNQNFSQGVVGLAEDFDRWATSLGKTKGFQDFIVYVQTNGPRVIELLGDTASLFVDIVKAAAPLGGPTVQALDLIVKALDAIANSPLGTPLLALAQINAVLKLTSRSLAAVGIESKMAFSGGSSLALGGNLTKLKGSLGESSKALFNYYSAEERATAKAGELEEKTSAVRSQFATGAVAAAAFGLATSGVADNMGLANTASLAMAGSLAGPVGIGVGATVGLLIDMGDAAKNDAAQIEAMHESVSKLASSNNIMALGKVAAQADALNEKIGNFGGGFGVDLGTKLSAKLSIPGNAFSSVSTALNRFNQGLTGSSDPVTKLTQLQAVANRMQPAMAKLGLTLDDLVNLPKDQLPSVVDHLVAITERSEKTIGSTKAVAQAFSSMGDQSLTAADRVDMLTTSLDNLIDPMLNLGAAHDAFKKGLNDISSSLSKNSKTLVGNSDAAIQNRDAIRGQVTNLKTWIEAQAKSGASAKTMSASLKAGRQAIIDQGKAAGLNAGQIQHMIDTMRLTPKLIKTLFQAETAQALTGIAAVDAAINGIDRVVNVHVNVTRNTNALLADVNTPKKHATGGPIVGPGGPRDDLIPALLSNGEYVMSAAAVARHGRSMFDALNVPHFASGGPVAATGGGASDGGATNSLRNLKQAADAATKSLDNEKQHRDALVSAEKQLASSITTSLRSDLFAETSAWGQGGSVGAVLGGDIANSRAFDKALHMLVRKGASGGLLAEAAQSGNLQGVQQFAGESRQQIARDERQYRERQRLTAGIGQHFAAQRFDPQIAESNRELKGLRGDVHTLTAQVKHLEHAQKDHPERAGAATGKQINAASGNAVRKQRHR